MRRFAFGNIVFWVLQHPITVAWYVLSPSVRAQGGPFLLYLVQISVAALWLSSLAWWQSTRVGENALTVDTLVEETEISPAQ